MTMRAVVDEGLPVLADHGVAVDGDGAKVRPLGIRERLDGGEVAAPLAVRLPGADAMRS